MSLKKTIFFFQKKKKRILNLHIQIEKWELGGGSHEFPLAPNDLSQRLRIYVNWIYDNQGPPPDPAPPYLLIFLLEVPFLSWSFRWRDQIDVLVVRSRIFFSRANIGVWECLEYLACPVLRICFISRVRFCFIKYLL